MNLSSITEKSLDLSNNSIGDEGTKALSLNSTLTTLNLHNNSIGPEGAKALSLNTTLTSLDLSYNSIGPELMAKIKEQLAFNQESLKKRRSQFLSKVMLLNMAKSKENDWSRLVPDLRYKILDLAAESSHLGTTSNDAKNCLKFLNSLTTLKFDRIVKGEKCQYRLE